MNFFSKVIHASKEVYHLINYSDSPLFAKQKEGYGGDLSMKVDLEAEKIFIDAFKDEGQIVTEERGVIGKANSVCFIIDPIDGSSNISNNIPYYGSSIAVKREDEVIASFVVNYANGDYFYKEGKKREKGNLFLQTEKKEQASNVDMILFEKAYANPVVSKKLYENGYKFRSPGALALSLVLADQVQALVFLGEVREFDVAAGLHYNEHLHIRKDNNLLIVSKSLEEFNKINEIIEG